MIRLLCLRENYIMRKILLLAFMLTTTTSFGQLGVYLTGGLTNTNIQVAKTRSHYSEKKYFPKTSWKGSLHIEYLNQRQWVFVSGLSLSSNRFLKKQYPQDAYIETEFTPLYLVVPLEAGYNFQFNKAISARVYGGAYANFGLGGKAIEFAEGYYPTPTMFKGRRSIRFGNASNYPENDDLTRNGWGLKVGAGLNLFNKTEVAFSYNQGMSNILPSDLSNYEIQKFGVFEVGVRYRLVGNLFK